MRSFFFETSHQVRTAMKKLFVPEGKSQRIRLSEPRRTLNESAFPAVQWRSKLMASHLLDRDCPNKVSMRKERRSRRMGE